MYHISATQTQRVNVDIRVAESEGIRSDSDS